MKITLFVLLVVSFVTPLGTLQADTVLFPAARVQKRMVAPLLEGQRVLVDGSIHAVDSLGDVPVGSVAGWVTVKRSDGSLLRFKMYTYSLILICNHVGCYAGHIRQLKLGWPVSAAYITEEEGGVSPPPTPGDDGVLEVLCDNMLIRLEPEDKSGIRP